MCVEVPFHITRWPTADTFPDVATASVIRDEPT